MAGKLTIRWVKSAIGSPKEQKDTLRALGLHKLNTVVEKEDNTSVRGMVNKVRHLVQVTES